MPIFNDLHYATPGSSYVEKPINDFVRVAAGLNQAYDTNKTKIDSLQMVKANLKGSNDITSYSHEELIAEMGSMLLCLQFGITSEFINSVRYLKFWSNKNNDNRVENIKTAFSQSKKSKKFLESL